MENAKDFLKSKNPKLSILLESQTMRSYVTDIMEEYAKQKCTELYDEFDKLKSDLNQVIKTEITDFLDFLLKEGYCDSDVYSEPPTVIDQYFKTKK